MAESNSVVTEIIEARQAAHVNDVDSAYHDAYAQLRVSAGQEVGQPDRLADSYARYLAFRRMLLAAKLERLHADQSKSGKYTENNRFNLGQCGDLGASHARSAVVKSALDGPPSYVAWRRVLLGSRFEKRRAAVEEQMIRRIAAEAMQKAIAAESAAREEYEEMASASGSASSGSGGGGPGGAGADDDVVWAVQRRITPTDEANDPAIMNAMTALGITPKSPATRRRALEASGLGKGRLGSAAAATATSTASATHGSHTSSGIVSSSVNAALAKTFFGNEALVFDGCRITAVAFCPINPDIFAVATDAGAAYLCSASTGLRWATLTGHESAITGLDWATSEGFIFLITVSPDTTARLWSVTLPDIRMPHQPSSGPHPPTPRSVRKDRAARRHSATAAATTATATAAAPAAASASPQTTAGSSSTPRRGGGGSGRDRAAELAEARAEMEAEAASRREWQQWQRGPVADGGSAECVQTIATDFPLTHVCFCPLNPTLVVVAAVEPEDYAGYEQEEEEAAAAAYGNYGGYEAGESKDAGADGAGGGGFAEEDGGAGGTGLGAVGKKVGGAFKRGFETTMKGTMAIVNKAGQVMTAGIPGGGMMMGIGHGRRSYANRHGYILVYDAVSGRLLHSRKVQGSQVGATLTRPHSYVTGMCFSADGTALYVADGRGLLHQYDVETEEGKQELRPLREHNVIFGESMLFSGTMKNMANNIMKGAIDLTASAGGGGAGGGGAGGEGGEGAGAGSSGEQPFMVSLFFKRDAALKASILVGLDSHNRIRAFAVPQPGANPLNLAAAQAAAADDASRAAIAVAAATVKASVLLAKTTVAVSTLGAVQVNTQPQAAELQQFVHYNSTVGFDPATFGAAAAGPAAGKTGPGGLPSLASLNLNPLNLPGLGGLGGLPGLGGTPPAVLFGCHTQICPFQESDAIVAVTEAGELFVVNPHGTRKDRDAPQRAADRRRSCIGLTGPTAANGSGIVSTQVVAKLVGHRAAVDRVAVSPFGDTIVSADESGTLFVWKRTPIQRLPPDEEGEGADASGSGSGAGSGSIGSRSRSSARPGLPRSHGGQGHGQGHGTGTVGRGTSAPPRARGLPSDWKGSSS